MRTLLGKFDFDWPLMVLAEQWHCSLFFPMSYANVLSVQSSVPTMFLLLLANRRVSNGRVPPFPTVTLTLTKEYRSSGFFSAMASPDAPIGVFTDKRNVHYHHRKKVIWRPFLAKKEKLSRPVVDTETL